MLPVAPVASSYTRYLHGEITSGAPPAHRHDGTADGSTGTALKYEEGVLGGCRSRGRHAAIVAYVCTSELARLENKLLEEARLKLQTQRSLI